MLTEKGGWHLGGSSIKKNMTLQWMTLQWLHIHVYILLLISLTWIPFDVGNVSRHHADIYQEVVPGRTRGHQSKCLAWWNNLVNPFSLNSTVLFEVYIF